KLGCHRFASMFFEPAATRPMPAKKLLIVQDDAAIRFALHRIFTQRGWHVDQASTFAEAIALLERPPDWIILDLDLPQGVGEDVLRKIRADKLPTRVIICAGPNGLLGMAEIVAMGPDLVMHKPIDHFALLGGIGVVDAN